jgi:hypothetical protein
MMDSCLTKRAVVLVAKEFWKNIRTVFPSIALQFRINKRTQRSYEVNQTNRFLRFGVRWYLTGQPGDERDAMTVFPGVALYAAETVHAIVVEVASSIVRIRRIVVAMVFRSVVISKDYERFVGNARSIERIEHLFDCPIHPADPVAIQSGLVSITEPFRRHDRCMRRGKQEVEGNESSAVPPYSMYSTAGTIISDMTDFRVEPGAIGPSLANMSSVLFGWLLENPGELSVSVARTPWYRESPGQSAAFSG